MLIRLFHLIKDLGWMIIEAKESEYSHLISTTLRFLIGRNQNYLQIQPELYLGSKGLSDHKKSQDHLHYRM